jgi:hypothetical protein
VNSEAAAKACAEQSGNPGVVVTNQGGLP